MSQVEVKLDRLAEKLQGGREDHLAEVESMRKVLKDALIKKNLKDNPALKQLLQTLRKREEGYSLLLSNKPTDERRVEWFARREECRFLLKFFEVDKTIEGIEKRLDYQLSDTVEESPEDSG